MNMVLLECNSMRPPGRLLMIADAVLVEPMLPSVQMIEPELLKVRSPIFVSLSKLMLTVAPESMSNLPDPLIPPCVQSKIVVLNPSFKA